MCKHHTSKKGKHTYTTKKVWFLFAMVLLVQKLGRTLKFHYKLEDHNQNSEALSASLQNFRSKISNFISQSFLKNELGSNLLSLAWLQNCFELIHISNKAFEKLALEIGYPMSKWGGKTIEQYLSCSLKLLDFLNGIASSVFHISEAKISFLHALSLVENSPSSAGQHLKKIPPRNLDMDYKEETFLVGIEEKPFSEKELAILEALIEVKRIGFWALGLVLSGLCMDAKPYMEIRRCIGGFEDSLIKGLDSRFSLIIEQQCVTTEVKEVNDAAMRFSAVISAGRWDEAAKELKRRLEVLENSIQGIKKKSNYLFSEVLATRNQLLDNSRIALQNPDQ